MRQGKSKENRTDMVIRILKMYEVFRQGKEIEKKSFCMEHDISERTFDRDIERIRLFLSESYSGYEVKYNPQRECYFIFGKREQGELSLLEFSVLLKILKRQQILEKNEFAGLIHSLQSVTERGDGESVKRIIKNEFEEYEEKKGRKAFLKLFGDLQKCIAARNIIRIELKEKECCKLDHIDFYPVAVELFDADFYLLGYQNEKDERLTMLKLEDVESFQVTLRKYRETITQQYCYQEGQQLIRKIRRKVEDT